VKKTFVLTEEFSIASDVPYDVLLHSAAPGYTIFGASDVETASDVARLRCEERYEVLELREVLDLPGTPIRVLRRVGVFHPTVKS
jgi:hypothetical protein